MESPDLSQSLVADFPPSSDSDHCADDVMSAESTASPVILYKPPTIWSLLRSTAINLILPFINGMMLGFGELFAHEAAFRLGWSSTKVFPTSRRTAHPVGPGIEIRQKDRQTIGINDMLALE